MKRALLLLALVAAGCGGPSAPTVPPTPPSPVYPNMVGGWGGSSADTWVAAGNITGSRVCNETWLITTQSGSTFSGAYQKTPGSLPDCAISGNVRGTVLPDGSMQIEEFGSGTTSECVLISTGGSTLTGTLSTAGNITAGAIITLRCPYRGGTLDYRFTHSVTLSRR